jgi:UDP-N-acetylglucosamine--N-acetylmuramyl-(pentapeptide) pyrophosphoryl-undecaprenol N-acetylglucosamine transferase
VSARPFSVLIAGGGTGGHLYPGLAVARELLRRRPEARVSFVGTARGLEATVIPREGLPLDTIRSAGLTGKAIGARLRGLALLPVSALDAWRVIAKRRPSVVIGVGGYSAGPVVMLAAVRGIPTIVLEQNAVPGVTNRWLARVVDAAAVNYDATVPYFGRKGFVAGNPVRPEFVARGKAMMDAATSTATTPPAAAHGPRRVLILGGSQGAHALNTTVPTAVAGWTTSTRVGIDVVHQTGPRDLDAVRADYARQGVTARVEAFLDPIVDEMALADLVVCRAGATTIAELAALGRPAVLVPLPSVDDHQLRNARVLAQAGAADVIAQRELTPARLTEVMTPLLADAARLQKMTVAMRSFARPDAAARIADRVEQLAGVGHERD